MDPKFTERMMAWVGVVDQLDYYQILQVDVKASMGQIRKAYHSQTKLFHPDRYFNLEDGELKQGIYKISKRITEAYVTLHDSQKRRYYDQQLVDTKRASLRYTEQSEQQQKKAKTEETGKTEKGRQFYRQGMAELKRKDYVAAERTFKMAMAYEPDNEQFKQLAKEAGDNIKTDYVIK
ncbi:MAG: DnaJ domain-containing protein [Deltaproteobacteria bacterium]|nr:DnaJ domain-containing protein [Deltaproteobacteria bacterium]MBW1872030.1 DnaJ domain-containing protein [Deltaproteobacteria bacterium]